MFGRRRRKLIARLLPDERIGAGLRKADLAETILAMATLGGSGNFGIDTDITGSFSLDLKDLSARNAFAVLLDAYNLDLVDRHGVLWVTRRSSVRAKVAAAGGDLWKAAVGALAAWLTAC